MKPAQHSYFQCPCVLQLVTSIPHAEGERVIQVQVDGVKAMVIGLDVPPSLEHLQWMFYKARMFGAWSFARDESE